MKFFSSKSDTSSVVSQDIPEEVRNAVSVMGAPAPRAVHSTDAKTASEPVVPASKKASPFLDSDMAASESSAVSNEPVKATQSPASAWNSQTAPELKPLFDAPQFTDGKKSKKLLWLAVSGVALIALGAGAWYFLMREEAPVPVVEIPVEPTPKATVSIAPVELPYSTTAPNYLSVDTETVTEANFRELLHQISGRILEARMTAPVEFLLTDKNNNPIAFSRFAYLMKLDLNADFLSLLDESFSLYVWNDGGKATLGLTLSMAGTPGTDLFKMQKEGTIPFALRALLYEGVAVPKEVTFRSGAYNGQEVRYVNIDAAKNISFDYAIRGKVWLIGTSKDALRAMLDK